MSHEETLHIAMEWLESITKDRLDPLRFRVITFGCVQNCFVLTNGTSEDYRL